MPFVASGSITIADVNDGLSLVLTQNACVIATDYLGEGGNYATALTTASVLFGMMDDSLNWTYSAVAAPGVLGVLVGRTYTVSGMTVDSGWVDITASKPGNPSMTARFSIVKSRQGSVGPGLVAVPSAAGFTFTDGVAAPGAQVIAIRAVRQNLTAPVFFYASNGAQLDTNLGVLTDEGWMTGNYLVGAGDVAYVDLADLGEDDQIYVTVTCGEATAVVTLPRINYFTAEPGATRNVFRGNHTLGTIYTLGDQVIYAGSGWTCRVHHTASAGNVPPTLPAEQNAWWVLAAVVGETGPQGQRGTKQVAVATAGTVWSNSEANAAIAAAGWGTPITGDVATLYNSAAAFSQTRVRTSGGTWSILSAFFGGDVLVDGTLTTNKLAAAAVTTEKLAAGAVVASKARFGDTSNLFVDPEVVDASSYSTSLTFGTQWNLETNITADAVPTIGRIVLYAGVVGEVLGKQFPMQPAQVLNIACTARTNGTGPVSGKVYAHFYSDAAGTTEIGTPTQVGITVATTAFMRLSATITSPVGCMTMRLGFAQETAGSARIPRFTYPVVRLVAAGDLLGPVTTDKITTSATNLVANADFSTGDFTNWLQWNNPAGSSIVPRAAVDVPANAPTPYVGKFVTSGGGTVSMFAATKAYSMAGAAQDGFPVTPGEVYSISITAAKSATFAAANVQVRVYFILNDGTYTTNIVPIGIATAITTSWATYSATFTPPADAVRGFGFVVCYGITTGAFYWTNLTIQKRVMANNLVDGAVGPAQLDQAALSVAGLAVFGGTLQSTNYVAGTSGWAIDNDGDVEFNSLQVRTDMILGDAIANRATTYRWPSMTIVATSDDPIQIGNTLTFKVAEYIGGMINPTNPGVWIVQGEVYGMADVECSVTFMLRRRPVGGSTWTLVDSKGFSVTGEVSHFRIYEVDGYSGFGMFAETDYEYGFFAYVASGYTPAGIQSVMLSLEQIRR